MLKFNTTSFILNPGEEVNIKGIVYMPSRENITKRAIIKVVMKMGIQIFTKDVSITARAIKGKAIGEPCDRDVECLSGNCAKKPAITYKFEGLIEEGRGVCAPKEEVTYPKFEEGEKIISFFKAIIEAIKKFLTKIFYPGMLKQVAVGSIIILTIHVVKYLKLKSK